MKKSIFIGSLALVTTMMFVGCDSKKRSLAEEQELLNAGMNIETVSILPTTQELSKCTEIAWEYDALSDSDKADCEANVKQIASEPHGYWYKIEDDTEIMCRNVPERLQTSWQTSNPYPLKNNDNSARSIKQSYKEGHFSIDSVSKDLGNPVLWVVASRRLGESSNVFCEIVNAKEENKIYGALHYEE